MLILGMKLHEEVVIDVPPSNEVQRIVVTLHDISRWSPTTPNRARLGFLAARVVTIHRRSVLDRIEDAGAGD
jgi:sRNA-binding carbon storage regulator CsrA